MSSPPCLISATSLIVTTASLALQIVPKTVAQQKRSKDYSKRVQAARDALADRRKKKPLKT
jgi:hypothetical protein